MALLCRQIECLGRIPCEATHLWLRVTAYEQDYSFYMATEPEHWQPVANMYAVPC